jgi:hypothetical protein
MMGALSLILLGFPLLLLEKMPSKKSCIFLMLALSAILKLRPLNRRLWGDFPLFFINNEAKPAIG